MSLHQPWLNPQSGTIRFQYQPYNPNQIHWQDPFGSITQSTPSYDVAYGTEVNRPDAIYHGIWDQYDNIGATAQSLLAQSIRNAEIEAKARQFWKVREAEQALINRQIAHNSQEISDALLERVVSSGTYDTGFKSDYIAGMVRDNQLYAMLYIFLLQQISKEGNRSAHSPLADDEFREATLRLMGGGWAASELLSRHVPKPWILRSTMAATKTRESR